MNNTLKFRILAILTPLIFISLEVIRSFIRPIYGKKQYGIISEILGWLPNYLAGLGFVLMGLLGILIVLKTISNNFLNLAVLTMTAVGFIGLFLHEITQSGTGLYYDIEDIYASAGGVITGYLIFLLTRKSIYVFLQEN